MAMILSIVSILLSFPSSTVATASPQSVESDLSIITHNDLYGNADQQRPSSLVLNPSIRPPHHDAPL
jgi:hypothetical protein